MQSQFLVEQLSPAQAQLIESQDGSKNVFLAGRFLVSEEQNGNGRIYKRENIQSVIERTMKQISEGYSMCGELNHPPGLSVDLSNVSHMITELKMDGNYGIGKAKILNTPSGQIAKALLDGGVRLGVSSRGTGEVNEGIVSNFDLVTIDIVANPSGPGCYPDIVRESMGDRKVMSLAEAVVHDEAAQKYFKKEMQNFLNKILKK